VWVRLCGLACVAAENAGKESAFQVEVHRLALQRRFRSDVSRYDLAVTRVG
jgi:hypothetical protein